MSKALCGAARLPITDESQQDKIKYSKNNMSIFEHHLSTLVEMRLIIFLIPTLSIDFYSALNVLKSCLLKPSTTENEFSNYNIIEVMLCLKVLITISA